MRKILVIFNVKKSKRKKLSLDWLRNFWSFYPVMFTHSFFVSLGLTIVAMSVTHKLGWNCVSSVVKIAVPGENGESMGTKLKITQFISVIAEYSFMHHL